MELIQALEKLSLEIRHNLNDSQFEDFESSVSILLDQISELDLGLKTQQVVRPTKRHKGSLCSTASSSQEDDSDGSSQQSNVPIFMDLLARGDYVNVTDSVRGISKLLSLGNEIELIYEKLITRQELPADSRSTESNIFVESNNHNEAILDNHVDEPKKYLLKAANGRIKRTTTLDIMSYSDIRLLCDTYKKLCVSCKPHIKYLPSLSRYNQYCDYLCNSSSTLTTMSIPSTMVETRDEASADLREEPNETKQIAIMDNTSDSGDETDLFEDDGFSQSVDYNETQLNQGDDKVDNWTENKLYINQ